MLLALGAKLVEQFKLREDEDTLGQWIAHHLAEKLTAYKTASGAAKAALEIELVDTILKFWRHRAYFPRGTRPFEGYDAVLRALESFDPKPEEGRYFRYFEADKLSKNATPASQAWLDAAKTFDRGARTMVNVCFQQAARASEQPDEAWLSAADVLAEAADRDFSFIRIITAREKDNEEPVDPAKIEKEKLEKKRQDLVQLIRGAMPILKLIDAHLEEIESQTNISEVAKASAKANPKARLTRKSKSKKTKRSASSSPKKRS